MHKRKTKRTTNIACIYIYAIGDDPTVDTPQSGAD